MRFKEKENKNELLPEFYDGNRSVYTFLTCVLTSKQVNISKFIFFLPYSLKNSAKRESPNLRKTELSFVGNVYKIPTLAFQAQSLTLLTFLMTN